MSRSTSTLSLGVMIKRYRLEHGLTQEELANQAGISVRTLAALESGSMHAPRRTTLNLLAQALDLTPDEMRAFLAQGRSSSTTPLYQILPTNLPASPTSLIGRESIATQIIHLLQQTHLRLLTLLGPAGVGKTHLALHVARHLLDDFPGGVYLVELAPLTQTSLLPSAVAAAVGAREQGKTHLTCRLHETLRDKRLLLLLDNCEHLSDIASSIADLLAACPPIKILATSRSSLHLRAEQIFAVPPLTLPPPERTLSSEELMQVPAIALFVQRAKAVNAAFALNADNTHVVAEICARLDGLPLALELAAARCRLLAPAEVLARLSERFTLLTDGMHDLPARQQSLRAALDWSYALLAPAEQRCFRHLGVFAGSATLEAISAVCGAPVEALVLRLLDHSLAQRVPTSDPARVTLLETLRAYAWELLGACGEREAVRAAHAAFYLTLAETAQAHLTSAARSFYVKQLELDRDNLRAALQWYQEMDAVEEGLRLAAALQWHWTNAGRFAEGRAWVETFLERDRVRGNPATPVTRARALSAAGRLAFNQADYAAAAAYERAALVIFTELHEREKEARCWNGLALIAEKQGDFDAATAAYQRALTIFTDLGHTFYMGTTTMNLGNVALLRGSLDEAESYYQQAAGYLSETDEPRVLAMVKGNLASLLSQHGDLAQAISLYRDILAIFLQLNDHDLLAETQMNLSHTLYQQGQWDEAETLGIEALNGQRRIHHERGVAYCLNNLGYIWHAQGRIDEGVDAFAESILTFQRIGNSPGVIGSLVGFAGVVTQQGALADAVRFVAAATAHAQALNMRFIPEEQARADETAAATKGALGDVTFAAAWEEGAAWSLDEAVAAVQRYLDA